MVLCASKHLFYVTARRGKWPLWICHPVEISTVPFSVLSKNEEELSCIEALRYTLQDIQLQQFFLGDFVDYAMDKVTRSLNDGTDAGIPSD